MLSEINERQSFAAKLLTNHAENGRVSQAYLLTGQTGSKAELATAFAAALNCLEKKYFRECECVSCHKMQTGNHPDFQILGEDLKVKSIKIEEIRKAIGDTSFKPYEGKWKVFVLLQAGRMTPDASNAILKTLEEPPPNTVFILTAESKMELLETIQSRCFEIRLKPEPVPVQEIGVLAFSGKTWEDFFEEQAGSERSEIKEVLDGLMTFFRRQLAEQTDSPLTLPRLKAVDLLLETKDALDSNVNPKIALTRLAMKFRKAQVK